MKLRKIKFNDFDEVMSKININNFFDKNSKEWPFSEEKLANYSEPARIFGDEIEIQINPKKYIDAFKLHNKMETSIKIASMLWNDFVYKKDGKIKRIPDNLMLNKEFWAYLNLTVFFDLTQKLKFDTNADLKDLGKIQRNYFNIGGNSKIDRTGLRWLWLLAKLTSVDNNFELTKIAYEYIDSFKALQECLLGRNSEILKAYCLAIKKMPENKARKLKDSKIRTIVPKHIRNFACSILMDAYVGTEELSELIKEQIEICIRELI